MIQLTKLDGHLIVVNSAHIVFAEATPDTVLTMAPGQRLMVKEPLSELVLRIAQSRTESSHG